MPNAIINADNGVVSGTAGLKTTGGDNGTLNIQTNGTTAITVSSAQAVTLATALGADSGGTGRTTLTANNVILGNGTSAVQLVAPGTSGNVLTSNGTTWASTAPAGGVTSFNTRTGAVTLTTSDVTTATAGASVGAIGTYALLYYPTADVAAGGTVGTNLYYSNTLSSATSSPSGTWRAMGFGRETTVYLRIA